jgi:hypothetical protein
LERRKKTIPVAAMQITTTLPTTPPTMAPIGTEAGVDVGVDMAVDVDALGDVLEDALEEMSDDVAAATYPGGYCVPVLMPLLPVDIGKPISSDWPVYVSSMLWVKPETLSQLPCAE